MQTFAFRAQEHLARGWPVFPTGVDKRPLTEHGMKDATDSLLVVEEWSHLWPDANVSVLTGRPSGIVVVDIDGESGERSLAELKAKWMSFPDTAMAKTGRGMHLYFSYMPIKSSASRLAPGIDIKGDRGAITAPISQHASGVVYEWIRKPEGKLPLLPLWVARMVAPKVYKEVATRSADVSRILDGVRNAPHGERNHTLNRAAFILGRMVQDGRQTEPEAITMLVEAGKSAGLDPVECKITVQSGFKSGVR